MAVLSLGENLFQRERVSNGCSLYSRNLKMSRLFCSSVICTYCRGGFPVSTISAIVTWMALFSILFSILSVFLFLPIFKPSAKSISIINHLISGIAHTFSSSHESYARHYHNARIIQNTRR